MVAIKFGGKIVNSLAEDVKKKLTGPRLLRFLRRMAPSMVAQVRREFVTRGGPSGDWEKLSGWNEGGRTQAKTRQAQRKTGVRDDSGAARDKNTAKNGVSKHAGYAREKEAGRTPGHGRFGAAVRGRDSGGLVASLVGIASAWGDGGTLELKAEGTNADGVEHQTILKTMTYGLNGQPVRSAVENMEQFEDRFVAELRKLVTEKT
jgi:hypothetical protein